MEKLNANVSVTIPVYNTSRYLRKCLDSLVSQTLKDIEFVIVDDGSTDDSGDICDEYAAKDNRFKVIHQKNGGLWKARQTGLDVANGDYIIVCDSDDWVESDMYEKLYDKAKESDADIVICGYYSEYSDGRKISRQNIFKENDGYVDLYDFMRYGAGASWIKLIKRSLFLKTNSSYESGINQGEDALIIYKLLRGNPKVVQINYCLYHYRRLIGGESYTNNTKMSSILQMKYIYDWLKGNYAQKEYKKIIFERAIDLAFACLRTRDLDKSFLMQFMKEELPYISFLRNNKTIKSLWILVVKTLPFGLSKQLFKVLYPIVYK